MVVVVQRQNSENIVVLVAGLAVVAALLLVPPIAVRVAVSALLWWRVDVATILPLSALHDSLVQNWQRTWFGSASSCFSASVRAVRIWVNCGRGRATAGTMARASGRAATMRLESMLRHCEYPEDMWMGSLRTWRLRCGGWWNCSIVCRSR